MAMFSQKPLPTLINFRSFLTVHSNSPSLYRFSPSIRKTCLRSTTNRYLLTRAFDSSSESSIGEHHLNKNDANSGPESVSFEVMGFSDDGYPSGDFMYRDIRGWERFIVKLRMLFAFPWERVRKGSVLIMKLRGEISDQLKSSFSSSLTLPQICENFIKASYDTRVSGIYLHIESLACGWGVVEELRRHILNFKKSGKFIVGYVPVCGEKEYYVACACEELYFPPSAYFSLYGLTVQASFLGGVFEKLGIEPLIQKIGKYKSAGDQLSRKTMSVENREMLTALLNNIYENWLENVSLTKGRNRVELEKLVNEGVYQVENMKKGGWITDIKYDDEVMSMLKSRLGLPDEKELPMVDYKKYSKVREWTLGLLGGKDKIAIIRASGSISRVRNTISLPGSGIIGEQFIEKIRTVRESKIYKAAVLRIDSPGGDALASDLMWREIKLLSTCIPVVASMSDVAASGGYYMAMAANTVVAENLTLTGSIGVITGKFNLEKLYERIGFNKEIISRGKYAELNVAEQRSLSPAEAELFANSARHFYNQFVEKAAISRSMSVEKMEEVAQGRVWTGGDGASRGLVDAIGGMSRAVAIAKQKANIPQDKEVRLVEISRPSPSLPDFVSGVGNFVAELMKVVQSLRSWDGVQARMDGMLFPNLDGGSFGINNPVILGLIKLFCGSL